MIIRGDAANLIHNREGRLAPDQQRQLQAMRAFRVPFLPMLFVGLALMGVGISRADVLGWVVVALGAVLLFNAWTRRQSQAALKTGVVQAITGQLEKIRPVPFAMFESELVINKRSYALLTKLGAQPLAVGQNYTIYVAKGVSRMGIIVAVETA